MIKEDCSDLGFGGHPDLGLQGGPLSALDSVDTGETASSTHCTPGFFFQCSLSKRLPGFGAGPTPCQTVWKVRVV